MFNLTFIAHFLFSLYLFYLFIYLCVPIEIISSWQMSPIAMFIRARTRRNFKQNCPHNFFNLTNIYNAIAIIFQPTFGMANSAPMKKTKQRQLTRKNNLKNWILAENLQKKTKNNLKNRFHLPLIYFKSASFQLFVSSFAGKVNWAHRYPKW